MNRLIAPKIPAGPWHSDGKEHDSHFYVSDKDGWDVAAVTTAQEGDAKDIARFLAASKDMAEALESLLDLAEGIDTLHLSKAAESGINHRLEKARAALLKAGYRFEADLGE